MSSLMRYPPQFLDRLRQHFRLSEVIGAHLTLRKAGREYHALCPFHNEKTPSFTINDEKAFYHCFGCGAHGDVINFTKEFNGLSWSQAVESLARDVGMELPKITQQAREMLMRSESLYGVMEKAALWFSQKLRENTGAEAREYLERRGIRRETLADFRLGYAPDAREGLKSYLLGLDIPLKDIEEVGLLSRNDTGQTQDKFRGRVIFPIREVTGRVVGFGGRLMVKHEFAPKYLNSPQTQLFDKGRLLYNADLARRALSRGQPLLVAEGYMDVIALHQAGFEASVAPLGTAVTQEHLRLLWQMADEPVMCLDGDAAGLKAMQRVATLALPMLTPGKSLRFCLLGEGEDPDSLIQAKGAAAMREAVEGALPLVEMLWRLEVESQPSATPEQRASAEQRVSRMVEGIEHAAVRRAYQEEIRQRFWNWGRQRARQGKFSARDKEAALFNTQSLRASTAGLSDAGRRDMCFRQMLTIVMYFPQLLLKPEVEASFHSLCPENAALKTLQEALVARWISEDLRRESFLHCAALAESAWEGHTRQFDLKQLLKQPEAEGEAVAYRYYLRLAAQLIEIQLHADLLTTAAQTGEDAQACARLIALQQQLQQLKAQESLLMEEGTR